MADAIKAIQTLKAQEFNTNAIPTYEIPVPPRVKDPRTIINTAAGVTAAVTTGALAAQGALSGFAWFAPAMAILSAINGLLGYFANKNVVSKNVAITPEAVK